MMSRFGGSLFVERRSKAKLLQEIETIAAVLHEGIPITLFPEGTSSNGDSVLPFKQALFSAVEKAKVDVQPVCIKYRLIDGKPVSPENRDRVFYYGHLSFFPQLMKLFFVRSVRGTVTFLEPVKTEGRERKEIVEEVYGKILGEYKKGNS
jgi:1-acyl-sn-glycerol-3-phosphate acyltransferase